MATRRVIKINKKNADAQYRTIGTEPRAGAKKKTGITYPAYTVTISIHPDWAKFLPLSPEWQALQQAYIPGAASVGEWKSSISRIARPIFAQFFDPPTHYIGIIGNSGNIIRTP